LPIDRGPLWELIAVLIVYSVSLIVELLVAAVFVLPAPTAAALRRDLVPALEHHLWAYSGQDSLWLHVTPATDPADRLAAPARDPCRSTVADAAFGGNSRPT